MSAIFDPCLAQVASWHAGRCFSQFEKSLRDPSQAQAAALRRALHVVSGSRYATQWNLRHDMTVADFRGAVPLQTFEDVRPYIDRVAAGETTALLHSAQRPLMFASSSGTTAKPKWIPVTPAFVADYRLGWNTFGVKMLMDHRDALLRDILQSSGREDAQHAPCGIPVGAITGLMARMQKRIVRRYYVGSAAVTRIEPPEDRYYTLMRLGICRDVAFAITANPATLVQLARVADGRSEALVRDIRDGTLTLTEGATPDVHVPRPDPARAMELEKLRSQTGRLSPAHYWRLSFLACWTGGSLSHYMPRVMDWYGPVPVRDIGLLASEGRVTIPTEDGASSGILDVRSGFFEFIPVEDNERPAPRTLLAEELTQGREYAVVLSNTTGLLRYRLNDVVLVTGWRDRVPLLEFRYRAGRVSSLAGEKLTEQQVIAGVNVVIKRLELRDLEVALAPVWTDPPRYRLWVSCNHRDFAAMLDQELCRQNEEYDARRKSGRLGELHLTPLPLDAFVAWHRSLRSQRGGAAEQFKAPALLNEAEAGGFERLVRSFPVILND